MALERREVFQGRSAIYKRKSVNSSVFFAACVVILFQTEDLIETEDNIHVLDSLS